MKKFTLEERLAYEEEIKPKDYRLEEIRRCIANCEKLLEKYLKGKTKDFLKTHTPVLNALQESIDM